VKKQKAALSGTLKQEFEKDLELFQYILVLLNDASPIRNVELMWAEDIFEPKQTIRLSTGEALVQLHPEPRAGQVRATPSTLFCDLVHGFGAHVDRTCARSDEPAKIRCRATGCSQVYPCHVGLTDIAVPVMCDGRYLGTLFSGQVLIGVPTAEGFTQVEAALQNQPHIDMAKLEKSYYRVPVVTQAQLAEMTRMLEVFSRYIANSWKRLEIMGEFQRVHERELSLDRRQLAEMLLSGEIANQHELHLLVRNVGLDRIPNRVLVLRMRTQSDGQSAEPAIGSHLTLGRVSHIVEDLCQSWPDTLACVVRPGELCIFTAQEFRSTAHERMSLEEMAQSTLRAVRAQSVSHARIGISLAHAQPQQLLRAYHEACSAIDAGLSSINFFAAPAARRQQPTESLARVLKALQLGEVSAVGAAVREFLAQAAPGGATSAQLQQSRGLLTWACEHLAIEVSNLGTDSAQIQAAKRQASGLIVTSTSPFAIADAFRCFVEQLFQLMAQTFSQREQKIVGEIHRIVREGDPAKISVQDLASALQLSAGHVSRVYSRTTGRTLEEYLIRRRLDTAKRLLLDPRLHVAEVAYRCGFCNPAYFSSVFKKYMRCTPREYATNPMRWNLVEPVSDSIATPPIQDQPIESWSSADTAL
jgi:AraC-like DNA-binding protein/ligand-binding sensor protein